MIKRFWRFVFYPAVIVMPILLDPANLSVTGTSIDGTPNWTVLIFPIAGIMIAIYDTIYNKEPDANN